MTLLLHILLHLMEKAVHFIKARTQNSKGNFLMCFGKTTMSTISYGRIIVGTKEPDRKDITPARVIELLSRSFCIT